MRLVRRSLLGLVVGVTAFGVAGWLLRPKPKWSVPLETGASFVEEPSDLSAGRNVFWMALSEYDDVHALAAIDAATGRTLRTIAAPKGFTSLRGRRLPDGSLAALASKGWGTGEDSWVAVFDATSDLPQIEYRVDGRAEVLRDGRRFWTVRPDGKEFVFRVADLATNATLHERRFPNRSDWDRVPKHDVSVDGSMLAFATSAVGPRGETPAVELWDVQHEILVQRFVASAPTEEFGPSELGFSRNGRFLDATFRLRRSQLDGEHAAGGEDFENQSFDLLRREVVSQAGRQWKPDPPLGSSHRSEIDVCDGGSGDTIYAAYEEEGPLHIALFRGREPLLSWRLVPSPQSANGAYEMYGARESGPNVTPLGSSDQLLVHLWAPSLDSAFPASLQTHLPESWRMPQQRLLWHHWPTNVWRDVGISGIIFDRLTRRDCVLLVIRPNAESDELLLQSWHLPPRDPRPPALAIAATCAVATWWLFAWRNRRRMRHASAGAA